MATTYTPPPEMTEQFASFTPLYVPTDTAPRIAGPTISAGLPHPAPEVREKRSVWRRPRWITGAVAVALLAAIGLTASLTLGRTSMLDARGTVLIADTAAVSYSEPGGPCDVGDPWSEVNEGTTVKVLDDTGRTIGHTTLESGYRIDDGCQFAFHLRLPADRHFYKLVVASHPPLTFTEDEVADGTSFGEVFGAE